MKLIEVKNKAQSLYMELRSMNVSHSLAMAAVVEMVVNICADVEEGKIVAEADEEGGEEQ